MIIETKYNVGDLVFILNNKGIQKEEIKSMTINIYKKGDNASDMNKEYTILYVLTGFRDHQREDFLFKTKEELIASL